MPNPGSAPYTPECNGRAYANVKGNYQALYTTVAYIGPITQPNSSTKLWSNYANNNTMCYTTYGPLDHGGYGYEPPPPFPFRPQSVEMVPTRATTKPCADPNNLTT
jgi:hypothetical protein